QNAVTDRQEAERIYQDALDALTVAEGEYSKIPPIVQMLLRCPRDLGMSGAAAVIMRYAFFRNRQFAPSGVRQALRYSSTAVKADPLSVDAWITRLSVSSNIADKNYRAIGDYAMRQVRTLNPNHPRFPEAEAAYYRQHGTKDQYEAALKR